MREPAHRIVSRYKRVTRHGIAGVEAHGKRRGKVPNVDRSRTHLNTYLVGDENLGDLVNARILEMQQENAARRIASLKKARRTTLRKQLEAAVAEAGDDMNALEKVVGWPWDKKNTQPFTEGMLSISHEWFVDDNGALDPVRVETFRGFAEAYIAHEFGADVLYARLDLDEKTPHVHFLIAPEHTHPQTGFRQLSHHSHRVLGQVDVQAVFDGDDKDVIERRSYEILQDRVADFASDYGLDVARGERRAARERMQRIAGEEVVKRNNVSPARGREIATILAGEASADRQAASQELVVARADRETAATDTQAAKAYARALTVGTDAILDDTLVYAPRRKDRPEGLDWGANKPADASVRQRLADTIRPARNWLIGFARRMLGLRAREQDLERREVESQRQAAVLARAEKRAGRPIDRDLAAIGSGTPISLDEDSFPGAWAIRPDAQDTLLRKRLDELTNRDLRATWIATGQALMILEEHKGPLYADYGRGETVLSYAATERGYDLEAGKHDPARATDQSRATLHTDQDANPIRVIRYVRERVRTKGS